MVRVRFAPSPTGYLHLGGARTALFNWLFARHNKGSFILRIEDTDRSRSTEEYIEAIIEGMRWLKLDWDEGPYRQTERFDIYRSYVDRLLKEGKAYRCYCTPEELEERRQKAISEGRTPGYDRRCLDIKEIIPDRPFAVRFKMPRTGEVVIRDLIKGAVVFENSQLDDLIIMRSDGTPTYNFVVVVDDVEMGITHVIRGDDHLNNTPKQVHIYQALGYDTPEFAHLPMILGADKTRLSKRHGATSVLAYRDMGYLPDALVNYLVRLGWSFGDQEIFTREELIEHFSFDNVGKSSAVFNPEKLLWLNSLYIMRSNERDLAEQVIPFLIKEGIIGAGSEIDIEWLSKAVRTLKERAKTLIDLARMLRYYIAHEVEYQEKAEMKFLTPQTLLYIKELRNSISELREFTVSEIERVFKELIERHHIKLGQVAQPVRVALTGGTESPGIFEVIEVMGKEKVLKRLDRAIEHIRRKHNIE
jgi:glutamyl-tRNA synthetase